MSSTREDIVVAAAAFRSRDDAEQAIDALQSAGFSKDNIGLAVREDSTEVDHQWLRTVENEAGVDAASSVAAGGLIGGLLGAGLALVIPGVGPAVAVGIIGTTIASGAFAGGLVGPLVSMGITEEEAQFLENEFQNGSIIVTVETQHRREDAQRVMREAGGLDNTYVEGERT